MADLDSSFREYYPPTDEQRKMAMTKGLISLDTNVLLDAYRFNPQAREELFDALEKLGDRLWISHQVALEFHKNRVNVIAGQASAYTDAIKTLGDLRKIFDNDVRPDLSKLASMVALTADEKREIVEPILSSITATVEAISKLQRQHGVSLDIVATDPVLKRLEKLLTGKVGNKLSPEEEEKVRAEADRRANKKIPPGYADKEKTDPAGDYLLWHQTLKEANCRKVPILIVTRDVKEDWFRREKGRTISARPELVREAKEETGCDLILMDTQSFLFNARYYLNAEVSDEFLSQVEKLPTMGEVSGPEEVLLATISKATQQTIIRACEDALMRRRVALNSNIGRIEELRMIEADPLIADHEKARIAMEIEVYGREQDEIRYELGALQAVKVQLGSGIANNANSVTYTRDLLNRIFEILDSFRMEMPVGLSAILRRA